jgi:transposase InsO family protein
VNRGVLCEFIAAEKTSYGLRRLSRLFPISRTSFYSWATVHHTDRGSQYTSYEFGTALRASGLLASMGRVGSAFDNAMAESVFATLQTELIYRRSWPSRHELERDPDSATSAPPTTRTSI